MSYDSLYGVHGVSWAVSGSEFAAEFRIPCNTTATIRLPPAVRIVTGADGLEFAKVSGSLQATAYSGVYRITCLL
jgi:hypothetical protein